MVVRIIDDSVELELAPLSVSAGSHGDYEEDHLTLARNSSGIGSPGLVRNSLPPLDAKSAPPLTAPEAHSEHDVMPGRERPLMGG